MMKSQMNGLTARASGQSVCVCAGTSLAGLLVSPVQQQEPGGFWQEWKRGELEQRRETVESEQPGPPLLSSKQLTAGAHFPHHHAASARAPFRACYIVSVCLPHGLH